MRHHRVVVAIAVLYAVAAPVVAQQPDAPVVSKAGMVISTSSIASDAGASVLAKGGNAVDAAVATAFALAVTHPSAGNIGGGGFMVYRPAKGTAMTIDYREKAPLGSTPTMYLDSTGKINRQLTATGYLAPGVPGTVRGMAAAHKKWGKLAWKADARTEDRNRRSIYVIAKRNLRYPLSDIFDLPDILPFRFKTFRQRQRNLQQ
jgi:gamma-glutamyltranspeptidase/glutathione hydrolase